MKKGIFIFLLFCLIVGMFVDDDKPKVELTGIEVYEKLFDYCKYLSHSEMVSALNDEGQMRLRQLERNRGFTNKDRKVFMKHCTTPEKAIAVAKLRVPHGSKDLKLLKFYVALDYATSYMSCVAMDTFYVD